MRSTRNILVTLAILTCLPAGIALAHGGSYRGPVRPPPGQQTPTDPLPPPVGPTTPGAGTPTTTPGGGPSIPHPPGAGGGALTPGGGGIPGRGRGASAPATSSLSNWTYWWNLNRERILDLRGIQTRRLRAKTKRASGLTMGGGSPNLPGSDDGRAKARAKLVDALLVATHDKNADVASGAVIALGKARDPRALPRLRKIVDDARSEHTVRESAALAIGMIGGGSDSRAFLTRVAGDRKVPTRTRAFATLGLGFLSDIGAIPALFDRARAKEPSRDVPECALLALGLLNEELVVPDLGRALSGPLSCREPDDILRAYRAAALAMLRFPSARPYLLLALRDKSVEVRRQAALALGAVAKPGDEETRKTLAWVLGSDRDAQTQAFAAISLGEIGDPAALGTLRYAYGKAESIVVPYVAIGLALLARNSKNESVKEQIVPFLRAQFLRKPSNNLEGALAVSLGIAEDHAATKPLLRVLTGKGDPELRSHAAIALGLIGDPQAVGPLRRVLETTGDPAIQREASLALGLMGDRGAVKILAKLVRRGSTDYVRGSAAVALGRLAGPEEATALKDLMEDRTASGPTRAFAAVALGLVLDESPIPVLSRIGDHLNHRMATGTVAEVLTLL